LAWIVVDDHSAFLVALVLARGKPLIPFQPLLQRTFAVSDRAADLDEWRPISAHARFGQPGRSAASFGVRRTTTGAPDFGNAQLA
jgi:hypothetical protein